MHRVLVTTITRECAVQETSGYLYVVDVDDAVVLARCSMMEASLRELDPNPRGGMRGGRGIAVDGDEIYIANFSAVYRFDAQWQCLNVLSHPACADIHDIAIHDGFVWVTSTRNDLLFQFYPDGRLVDCLNVRMLDPVQEFADQAEIRFPNEAGMLNADLRDPRSHDSGVSDGTHLNGIAFDPSGKMVLSLGRIEANGHSHSMLVSSNGGDRWDGLAFDDATVPRHNVALSDGCLIHNDTPSGEIVLIDALDGAERERIAIGDRYLRGLLQLDDGRLIVGAQNDLAIVALHGGDSPVTIRLSNDPRESVHSIAELPTTIGLPPVEFT